MKNFQEKLTQLTEIIRQEKDSKNKILKFFYDDKTFKKVLDKYIDLLKILETKELKQIKEFLISLIDFLLKIIEKCSPNEIHSTFEVANNINVPEFEDAYELNEYFNIVFYLYNLFADRNFDRNSFIQYEFSKDNLEKILKQVQKSSME